MFYLICNRFTTNLHSYPETGLCQLQKTYLNLLTEDANELFHVKFLMIYYEFVLQQETFKLLL